MNISMILLNYRKHSSLSFFLISLGEIGVVILFQETRIVRSRRLIPMRQVLKPKTKLGIYTFGSGENKPDNVV